LGSKGAKDHSQIGCEGQGEGLRMGNGECGMGNWELGMRNGEWGKRNAEWGMRNAEWEIRKKGIEQRIPAQKTRLSILE